MKLKTIEELTKKTLIERPMSRGDDFRLYAGVLKRMGVDLNMTLSEFFGKAKQCDYPALVSVPRARRKICNENPELEPAGIKQKRKEKEEEYRNYSKGE